MLGFFDWRLVCALKPNPVSITAAFSNGLRGSKYRENVERVGADQGIHDLRHYGARAFVLWRRHEFRFTSKFFLGKWPDR